MEIAFLHRFRVAHHGEKDGIQHGETYEGLVFFFHLRKCIWNQTSSQVKPQVVLESVHKINFCEKCPLELEVPEDYQPCSRVFFSGKCTWISWKPLKTTRSAEDCFFSGIMASGFLKAPDDYLACSRLFFCLEEWWMQLPVFKYTLSLGHYVLIGLVSGNDPEDY